MPPAPVFIVNEGVGGGGGGGEQQMQLLQFSLAPSFLALVMTLTGMVGTYVVLLPENF
jgi:hypothetical protein